MVGVKPSEWSAATITALHARLQPQSAIVVQTTDDPKANGTALIAAYAAAKLLTPNGAALATDNRACVIIPPGKYDLDHGTDDACVPLTLDTEFVDIIGLTTDRSLQHIYGTPEATNSGVIVQTANDVHISNLTVEILTYVEMVDDQPAYNIDYTDSAAYFPSTNLSSTVIKNINLIGTDDLSGLLYSMRWMIEYSGNYNEVIGNIGIFSANGGTASGTFNNCTGGNNAFVSNGTASGTFNNCIGGSDSFAGGGTASGTFNNCIGGEYSFAGNGTASGTFNNCIGGEYSFAGYGTASGTFTNCIGLGNAFGSSGIASGIFNYCTGTSNSFGGELGVKSGIYSFCKINNDNLYALSASILSVEIESGGTGYTVDDELTIVGGIGTAAILKVTSVASGVIDGIQILNVGSYTASPENAVSVTGGTGNNDATFNLTWNEGHIYGCVDSTGFIAEKNWNDPA